MSVCFPPGGNEHSRRKRPHFQDQPPMGASEIRPKLISSQLTARICLAWHRCARPLAFIGSLLPLPLLLEEPLFLGFHFCLSHHPPHGIRRFASGGISMSSGATRY